TVAVKLIQAELAANRQFRGRFAREVSAARKVGGFYTAQVVDADPDADPPWVATHYIRGITLAEAIQVHGRLSAGAVRLLGGGLAEGLAAIHACGLLHRDLKPSNVMLAEDGPRIIDFGIAAVLDGSIYEPTALAGTPSFMSPEQAQGRP